jgi:hypothetical protein
MCCLAAAVFCLASMELFPITWWNWEGVVYYGTGGGGLHDSNPNYNGTGSISIETYVIEGAGYFLNGYSDMLKFSNRYELVDLNGVDFTDMEKILDGAIFNMEKSKEAYSGLLLKAESTPLNPQAIEKLMRFDYNSFARKHAVNRPIFNEVITFLRKGNIDGLNRYNYSNISSIIEKLRVLKDDIASNRLPDVMKIMELNELFSRNLIAGQYGASIFGSIK